MTTPFNQPLESHTMSAPTLLDRTGMLVRGILVALLLAPAAVVADDDDPMRMVQSTTGELFARVQAKRDVLGADPAALEPLLEQVLLPHIDLERTSQLVLGKHWRQASQPQRDEFMFEFRRLLVRTYSTAVVEFSDVSVDYLGVRYAENGSEAIVRTRVNMRDGRPSVGIDYRVRSIGGTWKLFDVAIEGVSLVTTYRSSFNQDVGRIGLDGLVRALRERNRGQDGV